MTITLDLTPEEEAQLKAVASMRGVKPEEHAHTLLANLLRDVPVPEQEHFSDETERERLIDAVRSGDKEAWLELLYMAPHVSRLDLNTGELLPPIPDEALRRETCMKTGGHKPHH